ncbi:cell division protein ZapA [Breznakiella homolactica]|uniref:Cell division protein ZapA n=1 Tax=Breznakiella homolactica TaxID=2798577 RepID=A0A7T7XJ85_9SPIR|nr:cell division protein ZapA [Breznakiella homolactica]QQO07376.1 cell division protein ZapA [Breznakiella homolactica]
MPKSDLRINILGTSFTITADADPQYLQSLLERYKHFVENTKRTTGLDDPLKVAVLSGFLLCDEIEKVKEKKGIADSGYADFDEKEAEQLTLDLIARIDEALGD